MISLPGILLYELVMNSVDKHLTLLHFLTQLVLYKLISPFSLAMVTASELQCEGTIPMVGLIQHDTKINFLKQYHVLTSNKATVT